jgi:hypothetical protein
MAKSCSCCSKPADYSLALIVSTIGISPRNQRCSPVVPFCKNCIHALATEECWLGSTALFNALQHAYTTIMQDSNNRLSPDLIDSEAHAEEKHQRHLVERPLELLSP